MKNKMKTVLMAVLMGAGLFTSCADTESITPGDTTYDGKLTMKETADGTRKDTLVNIFAEAVTGEDINVLVNFTSTSGNMRRVYVTRNVAGAGEVPYTWEGSGITNNGDGSVNLDAGKSFTQELHIPKNSALAAGGTEEFKLWATNGKGDYRDVTNSFRVGVGTIKITYGSGTNPAAPVKAFTQTILAAPLANGASKTFMSTIDGKTYGFAAADAETAKFWDLGYYYGNTQKASLASAFNYPTDIVNISTVSGIPADQLNKCYFTISTTTSGEFDAIDTRSELDFVSASTSSPQRITDLSAGDIVEFVDGYGKKGLIRVAGIVTGSGTSGKITIDVKVQR